MKKSNIQAILWVLFSSALFLSGCGGGTGAETIGSVTLTSITVTPTTPSIVQGSTQQFTATGTYSDNSTDDVTSNATWTSTNTSRATVTSAGLATGTGVGTSTIGASLGGKTNSTQLTVTAVAVAPTITSQPANKSVTVGQTATFNVIATGTAPLSYQWRKGGTNVGTNSASYTTPATALGDNGASYSVVVSNATGSVTSNAATLTVTASSSSSYVADYRVATDAALRAIPDSHINTARTTLHVAYFHTSHGTHVSYGAFGLPGFKTGDDTKFGITHNTVADATKLDFHDFDANGSPYPDLSQADLGSWATWMNQVRSYLDNPANAAINV
ncbi:MAG: Ig-like domain-containing protein, partial [Gammaproteobacteria bacterium]|nr:Ig-like domain-containing protein [Gammaproteobacteria bacterium]